MKKLLLVGSVVHTSDYLNLIRDYFKEILFLTNKPPENIHTEYQILNFSLKNPLSVFLSIRKIKKAIAVFSPDIIHVHQVNSIAFLTLLAKPSNIPVVVTAWGSDILVNPHKNFLTKLMVKYILNRADYFTSDSAYLAEKMRELSPNKNLEITIANFGIKVIADNRQKENLIYSNRLHESLYRIPDIIETFASFCKKHNNWKLMIAGKGSETKRLVHLVSELGITDKVEFLGWLSKEQNQELYNRSRIFVSIPESDATSVSLLEAMACGCVPVVSDLPANREWIKDNRNGIIAANGETEFIERALLLNFDDVRRINSEIIAEHGTQDTNKKKFIRLYKNILKQ